MTFQISMLLLQKANLPSALFVVHLPRKLHDFSTPIGLVSNRQAKWPSTQGFITSWHEKDVTIPKKNFKRNVHETHLELLYEYQVGDSFFTGRAYRNCSASSAWHPGGSRQMINSDSDRIPVRVYYDPLHPRTSVLERAKFTFDWYLWPFFIGTALGICIYAYDLFFKKPK